MDSSPKCLNCGESLSNGAFCSNCGQASSIHRFDWNYLWQKVKNSIDIDQGLFYTFFVLVIKPGLAIRGYIEGKRRALSNPIKVFVISGAIATYVSFNIWSDYDSENFGALEFLNLPDQRGYGHYSTKYLSFFSLDAIPYFALFSWIFFLKDGFNYVEHLILNIYVASGQFILVGLLAPVFLIDSGDSVMIIYGMLNFAYNVWALIYFFKIQSVHRFFKVVAAVIIPAASTVLLNYLLYLLAPQSFWSFLDILFD